MSLNVTYSLAEKNIPPITWDDYCIYASNQYEKLLDSNPTEKLMQEFFEQNPCFIPGAYGSQTKSGHAPLHHCLFTQPKLPGISSKIPDFMWIAKNSDTIRPILIEIEAPTKKYFNKDHSISQKFFQAQTQISDWKSWFSIPSNLEIFKREYNIDDTFQYNKRKIEPYYVLIYGRSHETSNSQIRADRKSQLSNHNTLVMTYDRITPSNDQSHYFCGKLTSKGFYMHEFPEYLYLTPYLAEDMHKFKNKKESITKNTRISKLRKKFLIDRIDYWNEWVKANKQGLGLIRGSDKE